MLNGLLRSGKYVSVTLILQNCPGLEFAAIWGEWTLIRLMFLPSFFTEATVAFSV